MKRALTAVQAKNAKPKPDGKVNKLSDGGGLCLHVTTTGKSWRYNYRFKGKQKTLSLGMFPDISLQSAREKHESARQLLAEGVDPAAEKQQQKQVKIAEEKNSFESVATDWFQRFSVEWTVNHKNKIWSYLERDLFPVIGKIGVDEIDPPQVLTACNIVVERGAIHTAHKVKQTAGQVFRYGVAIGKCQRDPSADLKGALPTVREVNYPAITKPKQVGELLRAIEGYEGNFITRLALQLLSYVFTRPGELRHMEWSEVDFGTCVWTIPEGKMKSRREHRVPLAGQAISILQNILPLTQHAKYVFHGLRSQERPMSENTLNAALRKLGYSKEEMVSHGFRGMASSLLNEQGWNPDAIEAQLSHLQGDKVRAAYNRAQYWDERVKMMQEYADYLDELRQL